MCDKQSKLKKFKPTIRFQGINGCSKPPIDTYMTCSSGFYFSFDYVF